MSNRRFRFRKCWSVVLVGAIVLGVLLGGCGAEEPKVYRVGILIGLEFISVTADGFKAKMAELGYIEGENIVYDVQSIDVHEGAQEDAYKDAIQEFVANKVDLIFVFPTEPALVAKAVTQGTDIPIVFAIAHIEGNDLVDSVREPGGNITGVRYPGVDIALKRFEIMREIAPQAKRVWLPYLRDLPIIDSQLEVLRPAAEAEGVTLIEAPVDGAAELEAELQTYAQSDDVGIDFILLPVEPLVVTPEASAVVGKFATDHKIPIGGMLLMGDYGSVFEVHVDPASDGRDAATLADKIFRGTPAGTIPVLSAESVLRIDYTAAQELGLTVPEGLLSQAEEVLR